LEVGMKVIVHWHCDKMILTHLNVMIEV